MTIIFEHCKQNKEDAKLIMAWRNDPVTLSMSYHKSPKVWPLFYSEYTKEYFSDHEMTPLFAISNKNKIGFIKLDRETHPLNPNLTAARISINIAPEMRGKGLGSATLCSLNEYLREHSKIELAIAEIKAINKASINTFEKAGYVHFDHKQKYVEDINHTFEILRMIKLIDKDTL